MTLSELIEKLGGKLVQGDPELDDRRREFDASARTLSTLLLPRTRPRPRRRV